MPTLEGLVQAVVDGEPSAWQALQTELYPRIDAMARGHRSLRARHLQGSADEIADVRLATLERLGRESFRSLRQFLESSALRPESSFEAWLYGAVDFSVREHLRGRYGRAPKRTSKAPKQPRPDKRAVNSHADRYDDAGRNRTFLRSLSITSKLTVKAIFAHIDKHFAKTEAQALRLYYSQDRSFDEIAESLGLPSAEAADKLIRKLNARLRYRFA